MVLGIAVERKSEGTRVEGEVAGMIVVMMLELSPC